MTELIAVGRVSAIILDQFCNLTSSRCAKHRLKNGQRAIDREADAAAGQNPAIDDNGGGNGCRCRRKALYALEWRRRLRPVRRAAVS